MAKSEVHTQITFNLLRRKFQHLPCQRRLYADPEGVVHHVVGVGQVAADAVVGPCHTRWVLNELARRLMPCTM